MNRKLFIVLLVGALLFASALAEGDMVQTFSEDNTLLLQEDYTVDGKLAVGPDGFARHTLDYDDAGRVVREAFYDDSLALAANKQGIVIVTREYDENGRVSKIMYLGADEQPMLYSKLKAYGEICGYDASGNMNLEILLDAAGARMLNDDGWCEHRIVFNDKKQKVSERYFGIDGEPVLFKGDYSGIDRVFDENGNAVQETYCDASGSVGPNKSGIITVRKEYNEAKKVVKQSFFDENGAPMLVSGRYQVVQDYDENGNINLEILLDGEGARMLNADGWCEHRTVFNDKKQKVSERYFGVNGEPALFKGDYSGIDRVFDENGNTVQETYYDVTGGVGPNKNGIITVRKEYNEAKKVVKQSFFDENGAPMLVDGRCQVVQDYDENGNLTSEIQLDGDGARMLNEDGWCEHRTVFDDNRQKVSERYLGVDGEPVLFKDNYSGIDRVFDDNGNTVQETYYDATGSVGPNKSGIVIVRKEYNEAKKVVRQAYFDKDGAPMLVAGRCQVVQDYDEYGNMSSEILLDGEGARMLGADGWCEHRTVFDDRKQKISERYFGVDGEPVLFKGDYSGIDRVFDESGNVIQETYYDITGSVGPNKNDIITVRKAYNEDKKVVKQAFFDANGAPMPVKGRFQVEQGYDENGNMNLKILLDGEGARMLSEDGWCEHRTVFNDSKQKISERYYGVEGEPALFKGDYSGIDRVFDENGNAVQETYYDATGGVGANKNGIIAVKKQFDDNKRAVEQAYFDADGNPYAPESVGAEVLRNSYDDDGNVTWTGYFDAADNPASAVKGWSSAEFGYDADNHRVSEKYYDEHGHLVMTEDGYASVEKTYDELAT